MTYVEENLNEEKEGCCLQKQITHVERQSCLQKITLTFPKQISVNIAARLLVTLNNG